MTYLEQIVKARKVSTPLIGITTPDQSATVTSLTAAVQNGVPTPVLVWDGIRGITAANEEAKAIIAEKEINADTSARLTDALMHAATFPGVFRGKRGGAMLCLLNAQMYLKDEFCRQAIANLRDPYKTDQRMLVMLGPSLELPSELSNDVIVFDEPLPTRESLAGIVRQIWESTPKGGDPIEDEITRAAEALSGLSSFMAEQISAISFYRDDSKALHLNMDVLRERHRQTVEQTKGLSVDRSRETWDDVRGCSNIKRFLQRVATGRRPPRVIVRMDELDKAVGAAMSDSSGTQQDALGQILSYMEDMQPDGCTGLLAYGVPGCGKSLISKALAKLIDCPCVTLDLGAARGSLVGSSEAMIRQCLKVITAISGGNCLFFATCNKASVLPPELQSRFRLGQYMFDSPTEAERAAIWELYRRKYDIPATDPSPNDAQWTGREIRSCCENAWLLNCTLAEASRYVVPVAKARANEIDELRRWANGKIISADYDGVYKYEQPGQAAATGRYVEVG